MGTVHTRRLAVAVVVVLVTSKLMATYAVGVSTERLREMSRRRPMTMALVGATLKWEGAVKTDSPAPTVSRPSARTLMIVLSETCPYCEAAAPRWADALSTITSPAPLHVLITTNGGTRLAEIIAEGARQGGHSATIAAHDVTYRFSAQLGVFGVPDGVLLDRYGRVDLWVPVPDDKGVTALKRKLAETIFAQR